MSILRDTTINNNLNVSSHLSVDLKIINNDIIYPIITITNTTSTSAIIQVNIVKFNNNLTISGTPEIHWWMSNAKYSYPQVVTPSAVSTTFTLNNGLMLNPFTLSNSAELNTSITDVNHIFKFTINTEYSSAPSTYYFMCSVQGITYTHDTPISLFTSKT